MTVLGPAPARATVPSSQPAVAGFLPDAWTDCHAPIPLLPSPAVASDPPPPTQASRPMTATDAAHEPEPVKPPGTREFTIRSIVVAVLVAAVIGGSYPYVVLKLGFGPNISVVAAFFSYKVLGIAFRNFHRWENNIVQTAGTSAGQTAFLCTLMAAFDFLSMDPVANFKFVLQPHQAFLWLTCSGVLGVLLS